MVFIAAEASGAAQLAVVSRSAGQPSTSYAACSQVLPCVWQPQHHRRHLQHRPKRIVKAMSQVAREDQPAATQQQPQRLFSNLNPSTLKHEPGTVLGSAALVAGTTVGAGMLAIPIVTQDAGFIPSSGALVATCAFSIATGLLVAEVNLATMCALGAGGSSLVSMAGRTLGPTGMRAVSAVYLFLHYALLVAYISKGGSIVGDITGLPAWQGSFLAVASLGGLCFTASPKLLDSVNSVLVGLVIASFLGLLGNTAQGVDPVALTRGSWAAVPATLPVISLAFVYQNVVPVISSNLEGDRRKIRTAIVFGCLIPLFMFLSWDAAVLGSLGTPVEAVTNQDPLEVLAKGSQVTGALIRSFSLLAIATSFIGFVLGLVDFLSDALQLSARGRQVLPYGLTLAPPLALGLAFPDAFFKALDFAGTYGVLVLFGIVPAAMAWSERYGNSVLQVPPPPQLVPGGRAGLLAVGGVAAAIVLNEATEALLRLVAP